MLLRDGIAGYVRGVAAVTVAHAVAVVCALLLLGVFIFGGRIWKQPRLIRTIWQRETRDEIAGALRRSQPDGRTDDQDDKHPRG